MTKNLTILLTAAACAAPVMAGGRLIYSRDNDSNGLYELSTLNGAPTFLGQSGVTSNTVGLTESDNPNLLYGSSWTDMLHINSDGSGATSVGQVFAEGMAWDSNAKALYCSINGDFFTADPNTGARLSNPALPNADIEGLAYGNGGIYGLPRGEDRLYFYDIGSNSWSIIGNTGVNWDLAGLAYDPSTKTLYGKGAQDTLLWGIDPFTAQATKIGDTGFAEGGGLGYIVPAPGAGAVIGLGGLLVARRRR